MICFAWQGNFASLQRGKGFSLAGSPRRLQRCKFSGVKLETDYAPTIFLESQWIAWLCELLQFCWFTWIVWVKKLGVIFKSLSKQLQYSCIFLGALWPSGTNSSCWSRSKNLPCRGNHGGFKSKSSSPGHHCHHRDHHQYSSSWLWSPWSLSSQWSSADALGRECCMASVWQQKWDVEGEKR